MTDCAWESSKFITERQTSTCSSLVLLLVSLYKFLCLNTLYLIGGVHITKFQCQSEECFRMAIFKSDTQYQSDTRSELHMFQNGTLYAHDMKKKIKLRNKTYWSLKIPYYIRWQNDIKGIFPCFINLDMYHIWSFMCFLLLHASVRAEVYTTAELLIASVPLIDWFVPRKYTWHQSQ